MKFRFVETDSRGNVEGYETLPLSWGNNIALVLNEDADEVGVVSFNLHNKMLYIEYIYVNRRHRGSGVFKEMIIHLFRKYNEIETIEGCSTECAYEKWKGIGASIVCKELAKGLFDEGECAPFIIRKRDIL
ncbi:hypothetical protein UT300012_22440 [Paraclostridium bifermentans]